MTVTLARPWLQFDLGATHNILSWAINRPGFCTSDRITWREVRDEDFTPDFDVDKWLGRELAQNAREEDVVLLTSRDVSAYETVTTRVEEIEAQSVVTVGLSNGERVGARREDQALTYGTVNIALRLSCPLSQAAMLEAISIITQARTAAIIDHGPTLNGIGKITGTGTDCIALACPLGMESAAFAGLHTAIGEAIGASVYQAMCLGIATWKQEVMQ